MPAALGCGVFPADFTSPLIANSEKLEVSAEKYEKEESSPILDVGSANHLPMPSRSSYL